MSALYTTFSGAACKKEHLQPSRCFPPPPSDGAISPHKDPPATPGVLLANLRVGRGQQTPPPEGSTSQKLFRSSERRLSTAPMGRNIHDSKRLHDFYPQDASGILHVDPSGRRRGYNKPLMRSRKCHAKGVTGNARTGGHQESFPGCLCGHTAKLHVQTDGSLPWSASPCSPHKLLQH